MTSAILAAATGSNTVSGAVLTLVLPVACVLITLAVWYLVVRSGRHRSR